MWLTIACEQVRNQVGVVLWGVTSRFDTKSFRYMFIQSRWTVSRHWLKERRIFTQNVFVVYAQTILEVNEIFVHSYCLSYYRNDFVSKWPVSTPRMNRDAVRQRFAHRAFVEAKVRFNFIHSICLFLFVNSNLICFVNDESSLYIIGCCILR